MVPTLAMFPLLLCFALAVVDTHAAGILYPRASESRQILSLDGLWKFTMNNSTDRWYQVDFAASDGEIESVPVPASYNDLSTSYEFRDYVGNVWYQRKFFVPKSWDGERVWIRFSSAHRGAEVWINGESVVTHDFGHLPFQAEVSSVVTYGSENSITVAVDNTLNQTTIPQGTVEKLESGRLKQTFTYDFFNYAGIDRPVVLYTTPGTYIDDITVFTGIDGANGLVNYTVDVVGDDTVSTTVSLLDKTGTEVASNNDLTGTLIVQNANLWWPYLMDPNPGYLYSLQIQLLDASGNLLDKYSLPVGIRTVSWDSKSVKINDKPIYLRGVNRHEDSDIRGKGLDLSVVVRDYNLIKWLGVNAFRTSHYPYAEEIMDLADQLGIMVIDECPAINTENFSYELLANHKRSLTELIQRDKNRPGVIMWSGANEPRTQYEEAEDYYKEVIAHLKSLDTTRPVTLVNYIQPDEDHTGQFLDVACINVYHGWYDFTGDVDVITAEVLKVARRWNELHNIPVIMSEYGADTQEGLHLLPAYVWSEEYQDAFISRYFQAFDQMREEGFFIGEIVWNFADYKSPEMYTRVGGNKKGVFTRNRQPKASAYLLRQRYWALAEDLDGAKAPDDLKQYVIGTKKAKDEL